MVWKVHRPNSFYSFVKILTGNNERRYSADQCARFDRILVFGRQLTNLLNFHQNRIQTLSFTNNDVFCKHGLQSYDWRVGELVANAVLFGVVRIWFNFPARVKMHSIVFRTSCILSKLPDDMQCQVCWQRGREPTS